MTYDWQYYDLVLLAIAASMSTGGLVGALTDVNFTTAVVGFGVVAMLLVGHALFVAGPVDEPADLTNEVDADALPVDAPGFVAD
jgi:hypothetical protein